MDEIGVLENTVIVIYGDHDARINRNNYNYMYNYIGFKQIYREEYQYKSKYIILEIYFVRNGESYEEDFTKHLDLAYIIIFIYTDFDFSGIQLY